MDYSVDLDNDLVFCNCCSKFKINYFTSHIKTLKHIKYYNKINRNIF